MNFKQTLLLLIVILLHFDTLAYVPAGLANALTTYIPPSRKLQTFSSLFETKWKVSLMICCSVSSFCRMNRKTEIVKQREDGI